MDKNLKADKIKVRFEKKKKMYKTCSGLLFVEPNLSFL